MKLNGNRLLIIAVAVVAIPTGVCAQSAFGKFLGGAATALAAHESGHVVFDVVFDAGVDLEKVSAGPIPFFAITHHPVSPAREFAISSAGFWVQHASNELILARHPRLRTEHAPFLKGMFAFNVLTSVGYSVAAFSRRGPDERDTRGIAVSARVDEPWIGATILAPAMLDGARFYAPENTWLKWVSRAAKAGGALLIIRAAD